MTRTADTKALLQALRHIINEEADAATALLRQVMLSKARQAHESMLRGGSPLTEGWDDEIAVEEYFSEADLADTEDAPDSDPLASGDAVDTVDTAADEISGDLTGDDVAGELPTDLEGGDVDVSGDVAPAGDEDITAAEVKAELDAFAAEFEKFMAELDVDGDGDHDMDDHTTADAEGGDDSADEAPADGAGEEVEADDAADEAPAFGSTEDAGDAGDDVDEEDDFADITESVMAELEKVTASLIDGKEVGSNGKSVGSDKTSPIPASPSDVSKNALKIDSASHSHFDREAAPAVKTVPQRKFQRPKQSAVPAPSNSEGNTLKGASVKVGTTSPLSK